MEVPRQIGGLPLVTDPVQLSGRQRATYPTTQTVVGVLFVETVEALQSVLKDAGARQIPLYPVSRGRNWGYGSSVPVRTASVVVDLSRMDKVVRWDETLGYVAIQPGVAMGELAQFVRENMPSRYLPMTGAPAETSVLGNVLERGQALGPSGDRFAAATNLQVVLPDGAVIRTNFGAMPGAIAADVCKWGQGLLAEGLFTQSNFGVVTEATILLPKRPAYFQTCHVCVATEHAFDELVEALHNSMADGLVKETSAVFWNEFKLASRVGRFPSRSLADGQAMPRRYLDAWRREWGGGVWAGRIAFSAVTLMEAAGQRAATRRLLGQLDARQLWASGVEDRIRHAVDSLPWLRDRPALRRWSECVQEMHERSIFLGWPSERALDAVYWRKTEADFQNRTGDPTRTHAGLSGRRFHFRAEAPAYARRRSRSSSS